MKPTNTTNFALRNVGLAAALGALAAVFACSAHAASVTTWQLEKRMTSATGNVVIGEFTNTNRSGQVNVGYEVDISTSTEIYFFAISHAGSGLGSISAPSGWAIANVTKANWLVGRYGFEGSTSGTSLGSFESLFGTVDTHVIVFTAPAVVVQDQFGEEHFAGNMFENAGRTPTNRMDVNEADWSGSSFSPRFSRGGSIATEFIAVGSQGTIIGRSFNAIPEPSSALLLSLGVLGFTTRRQRKQAI